MDLMHGRIRKLWKCAVEMGTLAFNKTIPWGNILNKHLNSSAATVMYWGCLQLQFEYLHWVIVRWPWSIEHLLCRILYLFQLRVGVKLLCLPQCNLQLQSNAVFTKGWRRDVQVGIKLGKIVNWPLHSEQLLTWEGMVIWNMIGIFNTAEKSWNASELSSFSKQVPGSNTSVFLTFQCKYGVNTM